MGTIPTPRSFSRIVGDMADAFLSRFGIPRLRIGSPVLSLFEAAAMSDLRSTTEIFALLNSTDINTATGEALLRLAADEDLTPITEAPASGAVTVTDTRFQKIATKVYQGLPAPIVGTLSLHVLDASGMPASGSVFIARGTSNFEGPLAYSSKVDNGTHWTLNLTTGTRRYHNGGEAVVLAQGGNRSIGAGAVVQTPQGSGFDAVQFAVLYPATIPDGEVEIQGVVVVAKTAGVAGNIPAGAVSGFLSVPFSGATATNPAPFTNGEAAESDDDLRDRVKAARRSRTKGTAQAIQSSILGLTAPDENKRVTSASLVRRLEQPSALFIDDGTGYEEKSEGVAVEFLADSAIGGEKFFQLSTRPVAKAHVESATAAPFALSDGCELTVEVGGVATAHTFSADDFRAVGNATAFEVVASINANALLGFSARTSEGGTKVVVFAKADENEDIEVIASDGVDANAIFAFPGGRHDTLRLYRNDRPLSKDGAEASLRSVAFSTWGALSGSQTLELAVDGTPADTYTFTDQNFVDANTGFVTVGRNTLAAWVAVINAKVPGITASIDNGALLLTSNAGRTTRASVEILSGGLVVAGIFSVGSSQGRARDFDFDRNRAHIELTTALEPGDRLSVGSTATRGFVESDDILPVSLISAGHLYVAVDGTARIIPTGISSTTVFNVTSTATVTGTRRYTFTTTGTHFANVTAGDWLVIWDTAAAWNNFRGMWRVSGAGIAGPSTYVEFERGDIGAGPFNGLTLPDAGMVAVDYDGQLQRVDVPTGANYTADSFAEAINDGAEGATAGTWHTTRLRLRTNTFGADGDVSVVTANTEGQKMAFAFSDSAADAGESEEGHVGSLASGLRGVPSFTLPEVSVAVDADDFTATTALDGHLDHTLQGLKALGARVGNNRSFSSPIREATGANVTLQRPVPQHWTPQDRFFPSNPWALGPEDELAVLVDQNPATARFVVPMGRKLTTVGTSYGAANAYKDTSGGLLLSAFGGEFDFNDFAVFMHARAKSHSADATRSLLWRYKRVGAEGNQALVAYHYPAAPSRDLAVAVEFAVAAGETRVKVALPSSSPRLGTTLRTTTRLGYGYREDPGPPDALPVVVVACGMKITSASRTTNVTTLTLEIPNDGVARFNNHGLQAGDQVWVQSTSPGTFSSGLKTVVNLLTFTGQTIDFVTGDTVTETPSGATGVIAGQVDGGVSGTLFLTNVVGTFVGGQTLISSGPGNGTSGTYTPSTGATISYSEVGVNVGATANIGTVSFDTQGEALFSGAGIVVGDLVRLEDTTNIPTTWRGQTIRISTVKPQCVLGYAETNSGALPGSQTLTWQQLGDLSKLTFFPLREDTAQEVADAINDLDDLCPVTATVLGSGNGEILLSTREELLTVGAAYALVDGINWVKSTTVPPHNTSDYTLTFKAPITGALSTDSDWDNEEVFIVPVTTKNLVDWLNVLPVTGLSSLATVEASDQARRIQVATDTIGSQGSIEVQGGTANTTTAEVVGASQIVASTTSIATFPAGAVAGLHARQWVSLDNTVPLPKPGIFSSATVLNSIDVAGTFTFTAGPPLYTERAALPNATVQVERHGRFVAYVGAGHASVREGDWVYITPPTTPGTDISDANANIFRVVRSLATGFWVENPGAVEESEVDCDIRFFTPDSLMPGDVVSISTNLWGAANKAQWVVKWVGDPTDTPLLFTDPTKFQVEGAPVLFKNGTLTFTGQGVTNFAVGETVTESVSGATGIVVSQVDGGTAGTLTLTSVSGSFVGTQTLTGNTSGSTATSGVFTSTTPSLGADSTKVLALEGEGQRLIKRVHSLVCNQSTTALTDVKFDTSEGMSKVSAAAGTVLTVLDKLNFGLDVAEGVDGYSRVTGLIGEASRVLYGDERNPTAYPGVIAEGSNVNISGPLVRRIQLSLTLRVRTGVSKVDVVNQVRSSVATVVNQSKIGESIALSDIVEAAAGVSGVLAVAILSPEYNVGNDLISLQPFEKALVLNVDLDVLISFIDE